MVRAGSGWCCCDSGDMDSVEALPHEKDLKALWSESSPYCNMTLPKSSVLTGEPGSIVGSCS